MFEGLKIEMQVPRQILIEVYYLAYDEEGPKNDGNMGKPVSIPIMKWY